MKSLPSLVLGPRGFLGALRSFRGISRIGISLLGVLAAACGDSRAGDASKATGSSTSAVVAPGSGRPVVFVGLDGADWQFLDPLIARGSMPNLERLVREGRSGILRTQHPPLSPLVWTSMMTGRSPLEHRILDFTRFNPQTGQREPITSDERVAPAIWNMATSAGLRSAVLGMWATYPAEPGVGLVVSDRAIQSDESGAAAVSPASFEPEVAAARTSAARSVDWAAMRGYLPDLSEAEFSRAAGRPIAEAYGEPVSALHRILVETRTVQALALSALRTAPRLSIVYFEGTDTIGHVFAPFAPPRQASVAQAEYDRLHQVPERYFAEIDRDLGELRDAAARDGALLMLASDHGFRWSEGRPRELSSLAAASAARWHRDEGIFVLWGPGIPAGGLAHADLGGVRQVCSTLLALLGLPPATGVEEPPLAGLVDRGAPVDYGASFQRPAAATAAADSAEALARLRSLGYIGGGESAAGHVPGSTRTPASFNNEGLLLREAGKTQLATAAFQQALSLNAHYASAAWNLSDLLASEGREPERSDALLLQAITDGLPEGAERLVARAAAYRAAQGAERSVRILDDAVRLLPKEAPLWLYRGRYRLESKDCAGAREDFARSVALDAGSAVAEASLGTSELCLGEIAAAKRAFARSLRLDPAQPEVRRMLDSLQASDGSGGAGR